MMRSVTTSLKVRSILLLIFSSALPCALLAQANQASWSDLSALRKGQKIQVDDTNSKKYFGTFLNVSDAAISTQGNASEQSILRPQVRSVKLMENSHRLRNTLLGAGIGAGAGVKHPQEIRERGDATDRRARGWRAALLLKSHCRR